MEQRKLLERELDILRDRLLLMGGEVELSIQRAIHALVQRDSAAVAAEGRYASEWMLMARSSEALGALVEDPRWTHPIVPAGTHVWTDDFSDVLGVLKTNWAED